MKDKLRMKILHVCPNFYPVHGGIENFVFNLSKNLVKDGYGVTVVTSNKVPGSKRQLPSEKIKDGIKIRRFGFKKFSRYNTSVAALKYILNENFDILHIHGIGFFSDAIPLIKFLGKGKVVLSTHGGIFHTKKMKMIKNIYFNTMGRIAGRFSDKIIAVSEHDKKFMESVVDKKKIVVVKNGINWKKVGKIKRDGNGKTLVYFGRLASNKRVDKLLYLVKNLKISIPDVRLFVVGADWGVKRELADLVKDLAINKNVIFVGELDDKKLYKILSKSDIFLLASEYEGFGISVIEAMAAGLPVVVNNIETLRELVQNGKNGYIVDFNDVHQASRVTLRLLKSRQVREKIGKSARSYSKRFDWNIVAKNVEKIYEQLEN